MRGEHAFVCARPSCGRRVTGIYCDTHRAQLQDEIKANREEKAERMREMWRTRRTELLDSIAAAKAPAKEGQA